MSVKEKMSNNYLVTINKLNDIEKLKKVGVSTFVFALENYSIGYEKTFTVDEINNIKEKKLVLINTLLNCKKMDEIKEILPKIECDGFIFEDIGLINVLKNYKGLKILFMNHFNCNSESINNFLEYVDSVVISNELTLEEYKEITNKVNKKIVLNLFGYNQVMYSKRHLLSNFQEQFKLEKENFTEIKDKYGNTKFKVKEEQEGTIMLSNKIFDGRELLNLPNVLYYYLNTSYIAIEDTLFQTLIMAFYILKQYIN